MSKRIEINVNPVLLEWAIKRADVSLSMLKKKFPKIEDWVNELEHPTLRQLELFAKTVHAPLGYMFLSEPPQESLPIPDFRTVKDRNIDRLSPELLDTIYLCQQRQDWYREYARAYTLEMVDFIGTVTIKNDPVTVAENLRNRFNLSLEERRKLATWTEALRFMITKVEEAGILIMSSSIVGSNSHRKLSVEEFRGFTLADSYAPLIFINASDSKAAQMFTLVHELAHLCLGESGIYDTEAGRVPDAKNEKWCNEVAAEILMPIRLTKEMFHDNASVEEEIQRLARVFKVSSLVVVRRLYDAGFFNETELWQHYHDEIDKIRSVRQKSKGGNFYLTLSARTGKLFARAVLSSTLEGFTLFQDAFRMLGVKKTQTFYEAARELGVMV
jgi:Zn-dependent peptidase ImmA (M78 family)